MVAARYAAHDAAVPAECVAVVDCVAQCVLGSVGSLVVDLDLAGTAAGWGTADR